MKETISVLTRSNHTMKIKIMLPKLFAVVCLFAIAISTLALSQVPPLPAQITSPTACPTGSICPKKVAPGTYSGNGPYGSRSYTLSRLQTRGGATVYYPANAHPPFSGLVFTPPYTGVQAMYRAWGPFFASHGIVLVTMDTRTTLDTVDQRA